MSVDLGNMTEEQLEQELERRKKEKQRAENAKRKKYEQDREDLVNDLIIAAEHNHEALMLLKQQSFEKIQEFHKTMLEYGDVIKSSKGGFSIRDKADEQRVTFSIQNKKGFDERAEAAELKLMSFLESFVKKRDKKIYKMVMSLLERTNTGDFDVNLISRLYSMENDFEHPDWVDAIKLFKESYQPSKSTSYITFSKRDNAGKWQTIGLNFSSLPIE